MAVAFWNVKMAQFIWVISNKIYLMGLELYFMPVDKNTKAKF